MIKINIDAAFPAQASFFQVGIVARDHTCCCVWWSCKQLIGHPNPVDGEARAMVCALEVAKSQQWPRIVIEGDCLHVINTLSEGTKTLDSFGAILD